MQKQKNVKDKDKKLRIKCNISLNSSVKKNASYTSQKCYLFEGPYRYTGVK